MPFLEARPLDCPGFGYSGGPTFSTEVVQVRSGAEYRNSNWDLSRHRFDIGMMPRPQSEFLVIKNAFMIVKGRWMGFRFKDYEDFEASIDEGVLIPIVDGEPVESLAGFGYGVPTYQLGKLYVVGSLEHLRLITKPVSTIDVEQGGSPISPSVSYSTGIVTITASQTKSITTHTPGADHVIDLASAFSPNFSIGQRVYLSGVTGTAADLLNGKQHEITNVASDVLTLATNTTGLTASGGTASMFPQAGDSLEWEGEFDVPVRFDIDSFDGVIVNRQGADGELLIELPSIPLVETRDIA